MTVYKLHYSKDALFKLAEKGNDDAMYSIGYRYLEGIGGLAKNNAKAQEWFKKSADTGNQHALMMLKTIPVVVIEKQPIITVIKPVNIETTELRATAYKFHIEKITFSLKLSFNAALKRFFLRLILEGSFFSRLILS